MLITNIDEFGKMRANPYALTTNNMMLTDTCGCTDDPVCRDAILVVNPGVQTVTSIDYEGTTYTTDAPVLDLDGKQRYGVLGAKTLDDPLLVDWLTAIAEIYEVNTKVVIEASGSDYMILHYGAGTFDDLVVSGAAVIVEDRCCDTGAFIQYRLSAEGAIGDIDWNDTGAEALPNSPYAYTGVAATDEATAAQLETDLGAVLNTLAVPDLIDVEVSVDNNAGEFVMTYWTTSTVASVSGVLPFANVASKVGFTCALPVEPEG